MTFNHIKNIAMKNHLTAQKSLVLALCCAFTLALCYPTESQAERRKNVRQRAGNIRFDRGSEETTRDRERRLARECKGRANAGACSGFGG
jgi:hypothetical protein